LPNRQSAFLSARFVAFSFLPLSLGTTHTRLNLKWSPATGRLCPPLVVTVTSTGPGRAAGETAVMLVSELTAKLAAGTPPKLTALAPVKPAPAIDTVVPPVLEARDGVIKLTLGFGRNVN
jgi:hypothetical protein